MKKLFSVLFALSMLLLLAACGEEEVTLQQPIFGRIEVNEREPINEAGELVPYNVNRNEDIRVEIFLANPDNLQINAVSINGVSYRSHRFASGSTNSHIIIDFSAGNTIGPMTYTVESIEYSARGLLETMQIAERNTYEVNVIRNIPTVRFDRITPTVDTMEVNVPITDSDSVLTEITLILSHDGQTLEEQTLQPGQNNILFEDLLSGQNYSIRVEWTYNLLDGSGPNNEYIATEVSTPSKSTPTVSLVNEELLTTRYYFQIEYTDPSNVIAYENFEILLKSDDETVSEKVVSRHQLSNISFENLLANTEYSVEVRVSYDLNDGEGLRTEALLSFGFETLERTIPQITVSATPAAPANTPTTRLEVTLSNLNFEDMMDMSTFRLRLLDAEGVIVGKMDYIANTKAYTFFDLLYGYSYTLQLIGDVDFGDGEGYVEHILHEEQITTSSLSRPTVSIGVINLAGDTETGQPTFNFTTPINDPHNTLESVMLEVFAIPYEPNPDEDEDYVFDMLNYMINAQTVFDEDLEEDVIVGENILVANEGETPRTSHQFDLNTSTEYEYLIRVSMRYNLRNGGEDYEELHLDQRSFLVKTTPTPDEELEE